MHAKIFDYMTGEELIGNFHYALSDFIREGSEIKTGPFHRFRVQKIVTESNSNILGFPFGRAREPAGFYVEEIYSAPFRERLVREVGVAA